MSFVVVVLPQAEADIEQNARWWSENRSLEQALVWTYAVQEKINSLADRPERCRLARENDRFESEIRQLFVSLRSKLTHRILFTIVEEKVYVLTVRAVRQSDIEPLDIQLP